MSAFFIKTVNDLLTPHAVLEMWIKTEIPDLNYVHLK